jgi:endonuclease YncB( thermonuclease family)
MEVAGEEAKAKSSSAAAKRRARIKKLVELRKEREGDVAPTEKNRGQAAVSEARAANLLKLGNSLEPSNRSGAIDHYIRAVKAAPRGASATEARARLKKLGCDPELAVLPAYKVKKVLDSITIVVSVEGGEDVMTRLIGVRPPQQKPDAQARAPVETASATAYLRQLLDGKSVALQTDKSLPESDDQGRMLAYVFVMPEQLCVNRELLRLGHVELATEAAFSRLEDFRAASGGNAPSGTVDPARDAAKAKNRRKR